jgi:hypothetical protein
MGRKLHHQVVPLWSFVFVWFFLLFFLLMVFGCGFWWFAWSFSKCFRHGLERCVKCFCVCFCCYNMFCFFFNVFMYVVGELVSVERCQFEQIEGIGPTLDWQVPAIFIVNCWSFVINSERTQDLCWGMTSDMDCSHPFDPPLGSIIEASPGSQKLQLKHSTTKTQVECSGHWHRHHGKTTNV